MHTETGLTGDCVDLKILFLCRNVLFRNGKSVMVLICGINTFRVKLLGLMPRFHNWNNMAPLPLNPLVRV